MKTLHTGILAGLILTLSVPAMAATNFLGLEDRGYYDIYFGGDGGGYGSLVKNVLIVEMKEIGGKTFLVIQADSFGKFSTGLVAFEYVQAIVPSNKIQVQGTAGGVRY